MAILLFNFKLVHVPANTHWGLDGLSRHRLAPGEEEDDNPEDWVDQALLLGVWVISWPNATSQTQGTAAYSLSLKDHGDIDPVNTWRPQHNRQLPARYHTGELIPSTTPRIHAPQATDIEMDKCDTECIDYGNMPITPSTTSNSDEDNGKDSMPTKFSSSDKANKADQEMEQIRQYLIT